MIARRFITAVRSSRPTSRSTSARATASLARCSLSWARRWAPCWPRKASRASTTANQRPLTTRCAGVAIGRSTPSPRSGDHEAHRQGERGRAEDDAAELHPQRAEREDDEAAHHQRHADLRRPEQEGHRQRRVGDHLLHHQVMVAGALRQAAVEHDVGGGAEQQPRRQVGRRHLPGDHAGREVGAEQDRVDDVAGDDEGQHPQPLAAPPQQRLGRQGGRLMQRPGQDARAGFERVRRQHDPGSIGVKPPRLDPPVVTKCRPY